MAKNFNHPKVVASYDEHIRKLIPAYDLVHHQILSILKARLKLQPNILIVGCGTGYELEYLVRTFPKAHFVAIDLAHEMLSKAQSRLNENQKERVQFILGDTTVLQSLSIQFDCALTILVMHFIALEHKHVFFQDIYAALDENGFCLTYDLYCFENELEQQQLKYLLDENGLQGHQIRAMFERLEDDFALIEISEVKKILNEVGFANVKTFSQSLNFYGQVIEK